MGTGRMSFLILIKIEMIFAFLILQIVWACSIDGDCLNNCTCHDGLCKNAKGSSFFGDRCEMGSLSLNCSSDSATLGISIYDEKLRYQMQHNIKQLYVGKSGVGDDLVLHAPK